MVLLLILKVLLFASFHLLAHLPENSLAQAFYPWNFGFGFQSSDDMAPPNYREARMLDTLGLPVFDPLGSIFGNPYSPVYQWESAFPKSSSEKAKPNSLATAVSTPALLDSVGAIQNADKSSIVSTGVTSLDVNAKPFTGLPAHPADPLPSKSDGVVVKPDVLRTILLALKASQAPAGDGSRRSKSNKRKESRTTTSAPAIAVRPAVVLRREPVVMSRKRSRIKGAGRG